MIPLILAIADPVLTANGFARSDREYSTSRTPPEDWRKKLKALEGE
jgi:hypothetical protein